jgi:hypothetical protein
VLLLPSMPIYTDDSDILTVPSFTGKDNFYLSKYTSIFLLENKKNIGHRCRIRSQQLTNWVLIGLFMSGIV